MRSRLVSLTLTILWLAERVARKLPKGFLSATVGAPLSAALITSARLPRLSATHSSEVRLEALMLRLI